MGGVGGWIVYSAYQYKHTMLPTQSALSRASTIGWIGLGAMGKVSLSLSIWAKQGRAELNNRPSYGP
jgi:hypothetical protein